MGHRCDRVQFVWRKALSVANPRSAQQRSGQLHDLRPPCASYGDDHAGSGVCRNPGRNKPDSSLRPGLAVSAQTVPTDASREGHPAEHEPERKLSGQRRDRKFFGLLKSELLYLQEFQSMQHFKQELVEYLDYYNNRRNKAKLKGLPPAIHRQQALSAA